MNPFFSIDINTIINQYNMSKTIPCYFCSVPIMQVYEKSIGSYIYEYCSRACAEKDFATCSNCGEAEVSKKDCIQKLYGCCHQYLGGNPQYYCSEICEDEDTTNFIRSFRKPVNKN